MRLLRWCERGPDRRLRAVFAPRADRTPGPRRALNPRNNLYCFLAELAIREIEPPIGDSNSAARVVERKVSQKWLANLKVQRSAVLRINRVEYAVCVEAQIGELRRPLRPAREQLLNVQVPIRASGRDRSVESARKYRPEGVTRCS